LDNIKAFSNVKLLSYVPAEEEVLFMVGSIFQLDKVQCDNDGIWNIKMVLCSDNSNQLKTLYEQMKNKLGTGETDLLRFGHVLRGMGKLDDAEKYVRRFLVQLPDHDPNISHGYHALGMVSDLKGEFEASLKWYNKSLKIKMQTLDPNHSNIANANNCIGEVYRKKGDYAHALESYKKALLIWQNIYGEDHLNVATCLNNMGLIYQAKNNYTMAAEFHQKVLIIRQNIFQIMILS
jgi:tetratricopeptide (TPR) repeat protein